MGQLGGAGLRYSSSSARHQVTLRDHGYGLNASRSVPVCSPAFAGTHCAYPRRDNQADLTWVAGYIPRWFTRRRQSPILVLTGPGVAQPR